MSTIAIHLLLLLDLMSALSFLYALLCHWMLCAHTFILYIKLLIASRLSHKSIMLRWVVRQNWGAHSFEAISLHPLYQVSMEETSSISTPCTKFPSKHHQMLLQKIFQRSKRKWSPQNPSLALRSRWYHCNWFSLPKRWLY